MQYQDLTGISREEYETVFTSGSPAEAGEAMLRLAASDPDVGWVEQQCLTGLSDRRLEVRLAAATALGHVARRQLGLNPETLARLSALRSDPQIGGRVEDALDDAEVFSRQRSVGRGHDDTN